MLTYLNYWIVVCHMLFKWSPAKTVRWARRRYGFPYPQAIRGSITKLRPDISYPRSWTDCTRARKADLRSLRWNGG
jgi:hypothetical protein